MAKCKIETCENFTDHDGGYCKSCYFTKIKPLNSNSKEPVKDKNFKNPPSEGEIYIKEFFRRYKIKAITEFKTEKLKGDKKAFRVIDFYLPEYKIFVEFFGQWDSGENNERYLEKKDIYKANKMPCVYLYKENLGFLPFAFDRRIQKVLETNEMFSKLKKYRWFKFYKATIYRWFFSGLLIGLLAITDYTINKELNLQFILFFSSILVYQLFKICITYWKIFKKNLFPLDQLD